MLAYETRALGMTGMKAGIGMHELSCGELQHPKLGALMHSFLAKTKPTSSAIRKIELLGMAAVAMVPMGLAWVKGTVGSVLAVVGGLVGIACTMASSKRSAPARVAIELREKGIACQQGKGRRELLWNEVVEVRSKRHEFVGAGQTLALLFEVVGEPPLVLVIGGPLGDAQDAHGFIQALSEVWLQVWSRRARAILISGGGPVRVGSAELFAERVIVSDRSLDWRAIQSVEASSEGDRLRTDGGLEQVERDGSIEPFPSTAKRLVALASAMRS